MPGATKPERPANRKGNPAWVPGKSANPKGRPVNEGRKAALAMMWAAAPELMALAIERAKTDNLVLRALIGKILPDHVDVGGQVGVSIRRYSVSELRIALTRAVGEVSAMRRALLEHEDEDEDHDIDGDGADNGSGADPGLAE